MRQILFIITLGEVSALVRTARFLALQGGLDDRSSNIEHVGKLQCHGQFGVERVAVVFDGDVAEPLVIISSFVPTFKLLTGISFWARSQPVY